MLQRDLLFILASTSAIKKNALMGALKATEALKAKGAPSPVLQVMDDIPSNVPNQPRSAQIELGARNRSHGARIALGVGGTAYFVGIENGLRHKRGSNNTEEDVAVISILCPEDTELLGTSIAVEIPEDIRLTTLARGPSVTWGEVLAEKYGCDPKDPHSFVTNGVYSREGLLQMAIETMLYQLSIFHPET